MNSSKHAGRAKKTIVVSLVGLAVVSVHLAEAQQQSDRVISFEPFQWLGYEKGLERGHVLLTAISRSAY